jgi:hypothetical protein
MGAFATILAGIILLSVPVLLLLQSKARTKYKSDLAEIKTLTMERTQWLDDLHTRMDELERRDSQLEPQASEDVATDRLWLTAAVLQKAMRERDKVARESQEAISRARRERDKVVREGQEAISRARREHDKAVRQSLETYKESLEAVRESQEAISRARRKSRGITRAVDLQRYYLASIHEETILNRHDLFEFYKAAIRAMYPLSVNQINHPTPKTAKAYPEWLDDVDPEDSLEIEDLRRKDIWWRGSHGPLEGTAFQPA